MASPDDEQPTPAEPVDDLVSSSHTITVKRRKLAYTATTGRIVLRQEVVTDGKFDGHVPKAEVFVTAYTVDGEERRKERYRHILRGCQQRITPED